MGLLDKIGSFGGGLAEGALGGIGGSIFGTPSRTDPSRVAPFQQPFLESLYGRAQQATQGPALSGLEQAGMQQQLGAIGELSPFISGAQQAGQLLTSPGLLDPRSNPFLARTAQAAVSPLFQQLTESILPSIRGGAIGAGGFGGSRQGIAEGIAGRGALQSAGDVMSNIFSQAYGQGLGALQGGLQLAPQTAQLGLLPGQLTQQIGAQQRMAPIEQLGQFQSLLGAPIVLGGGGTGRQPGLLENINLAVGM